MRTLLALLAFTTAAFAQPQQSPPAVQALSEKLMQEINAGLQCSIQLKTDEAKIAELEAKVKELEGKNAK